MKPCKMCGKEKGPSYLKSSYCKDCTIERTKVWRSNNPGWAKKSWENSKKREIRNLLCSKCGLEKEPKWAHTSYCSSCASKKARKWEERNKGKKEESKEKRRLIRQSTECAECGKIFIRKRGQKVCSLRCKLLNEKTISSSGCWIAPVLMGKGYGSICFDGKKSQYSHRVSYEEFKGKIPLGMSVCHQCDVPSCYNPDHLFLGTQKENVHDGIKKGRIKHMIPKNQHLEEK